MVEATISFTKFRIINPIKIAKTHLTPPTKTNTPGTPKNLGLLLTPGVPGVKPANPRPEVREGLHWHIRKKVHGISSCDMCFFFQGFLAEKWFQSPNSVRNFVSKNRDIMTFEYTSWLIGILWINGLCLHYTTKIYQNSIILYIQQINRVKWSLPMSLFVVFPSWSLTKWLTHSSSNRLWYVMILNWVHLLSGWFVNSFHGYHHCIRVFMEFKHIKCSE